MKIVSNKNNVFLFVLLALFFCVMNSPQAAEKHPLYVGWAEIDITPTQPVALVGQLHKRISTGVLDPLTATALALETRDENGAVEQAILISCDVIGIRKVMQDTVKQHVRETLQDFDADKLFMNATHTHTAPGFADGEYGDLYDVSGDEGVMTPSEYGKFFAERIAEVAVKAWQNRKSGGMSWGLGHAAVGYNRRAHYFDGTSVMYGKTEEENFSNIEGYQDHGVELLFFRNADEKLTGIVINLACPSQETEGLKEVSADFWHDVRNELRARFGQDFFVLPQCSAAGDQSPHLLYRKKAEQIMLDRRGITRRQEIARRIADAVADVYPLAMKDVEREILFKHVVASIDIPPHPNYIQPFYQTEQVTPIEVHILRLGDLAMASNPYELYLDYGLRIKARSPALLTFLVQLSCQSNGYLPTQRAVEGGGYSADKFIAGPEGGQKLVNETVRLIQEMWEEK
ncbi:MAG: hypothetical protein C4527_22640 [Candidatus Omnitrophota bacterium]|jgi:hypothetical protein|nr:MAG: hypothetical protein C4527_22640 [Candidatus Omnitrophota bacterium]